MGLQQHLLIQGYFISPKVINHVMQVPTNRIRACLCPAGILQTQCGDHERMNATEAAK